MIHMWIIAELSPVQDLQMAHHSDVCILLQWTPPLSPTHDSSHYDSSHSVAKRLGYRVYVNGVAEGLVSIKVLPQCGIMVPNWYLWCQQNTKICLLFWRPFGCVPEATGLDAWL